ncbi:cytochrome P450, partial [Jimgerdemannia flammicorona]
VLNPNSPLFLQFAFWILQTFTLNTIHFAAYQTFETGMENTIPKMIFGSHLDSTSAKILGYGVSLGVALYLAQRWKDGNKQSIPLVPYQIPIIGSTWEWDANPTKFIKDATEKYGSVFRIYTNGRVKTVVGKELVRNVATDENLSFLKAFTDSFDIEYMTRGNKPESMDMHAIIAKHITPNLKSYTPRVVRKELCNDEEFLMTAKIFTTDIGNVISKITWTALIPGLSFLYQRNPTSRHRAVVCRVTGPEIERRKKEAREQGDSWNRPQDILQILIDNFPSDTPAPVVTQDVSHNLLTLIFVSIHTTTMHSVLALYVLADYEEYVQELLDEQDAVMAEEEAEEEAGEPRADFGFSPKAIKKMAKLDSLLRESIMYDEELQGPDPENFNPWRFVNKNKQATKVGVDYLRFGMGKHACPGRFFAIQVIKTILCILIRKYRIVRPTPAVPRSIKANPQGPLMFIKRE